jgi:signal transduction histidine kinase
VGGAGATAALYRRPLMDLSVAHRSRIAVLVTGLGVTGAVTGARIAEHRSHPVTELEAAAGLALLLVGLLAWERRPASRAGALTAAAGLLWLLADRLLLAALDAAGPPHWLGAAAPYLLPIAVMTLPLRLLAGMVRESLAEAAAIARENRRLDATVREQLAEVRASRTRIVAAADAARRRIERDLHDGAQQRLVNVALGLRMARDQLGTEAPGTLLGTLEDTAEQVRLALAELRDLATGIHPTLLTEAGLAPALESIAERSPVPLEVRCEPGQRLPGDVEAAAYYVVSEAVANVSKHAHARRAVVTVARDGGRVRVEVADDGVGGADASRGSGLGGLADRVAALDGRLDVVSPAAGGTRVVAEIPCA